jgi:hypothetical protein
MACVSRMFALLSRRFITDEHELVFVVRFSHFQPETDDRRVNPYHRNLCHEFHSIENTSRHSFTRTIDLRTHISGMRSFLRYRSMKFSTRIVSCDIHVLLLIFKG